LHQRVLEGGNVQLEVIMLSHLVWLCDHESDFTDHADRGVTRTNHAKGSITKSVVTSFTMKSVFTSFTMLAQGYSPVSLWSTRSDRRACSLIPCSPHVFHASRTSLYLQSHRVS
jgi:hypothetical protein